MSDADRKQLRRVGAAPSKTLRKGATLGLEGARKRLTASIASFPPWELLPGCVLCWVRFDHGDFVAGCACLTAYKQEELLWQDEECEDADPDLEAERE